MDKFARKYIQTFESELLKKTATPLGSPVVAQAYSPYRGGAPGSEDVGSSNRAAGVLGGLAKGLFEDFTYGPIIRHEENKANMIDNFQNGQYRDAARDGLYMLGNKLETAGNAMTIGSLLLGPEAAAPAAAAKAGLRNVIRRQAIKLLGSSFPRRLNTTKNLYFNGQFGVNGAQIAGEYWKHRNDLSGRYHTTAASEGLFSPALNKKDLPVWHASLEGINDDRKIEGPLQPLPLREGLLLRENYDKAPDGAKKPFNLQNTFKVDGSGLTGQNWIGTRDSQWNEIPDTFVPPTGQVQMYQPPIENPTTPEPAPKSNLPHPILGGLTGAGLAVGALGAGSLISSYLANRARKKKEQEESLSE